MFDVIHSMYQNKMISISTYLQMMRRVEETSLLRDKIKNITIDMNQETSDNVNHPKYYNEHPSGVECIEIARHYCFSIGNAIKYLWRAGLKKDASLTDKEKEIEDLKKAIWYIQDRISELENETMDKR
jgi:translation initiation factor 2B subunit (eIF-2B alpha/beta/delta family)